MLMIGTIIEWGKGMMEAIKCTKKVSHCVMPMATFIAIVFGFAILMVGFVGSYLEISDPKRELKDYTMVCIVGGGTIVLLGLSLAGLFFVQIWACFPYIFTYKTSKSITKRADCQHNCGKRINQ